MSMKYTPLEERFAKKLEELRENSGLTREELAEDVGLSSRHISALERGERCPTLNTMEKLIRTLGAPTEWLAYPELEDKNSCVEEITRMAATFSQEQQDLILGFMQLLRKQERKYKKR